METRKTVKPFAPEVRERAVRMVREHREAHASQWSAIQSIAAKIGCSGETLRNWVRQAERDDGARPGPTSEERERIRALEREVRELRQSLSGLDPGPTSSCARLRRILRWRSSTADRSHDRLRRRSPCVLRGRADLPTAADRPVDVPCPCHRPTRAGPGVRPRPAGRRAAPRDRAGARRELRRLRRAQGVEAAASRGRRGGPVHRGAADASDGVAGRGAGEDREDDGPEPGSTLPAGPREPTVPRALAEPAVGQRLHLRRHLVRLRLRRLRHRRLCPSHRGPGG